MVLQFNLEMSMRVQDLIGADLDRAVAKALKLPPPYYDADGTVARFSSRWDLGGSIIEREKITCGWDWNHGAGHMGFAEKRNNTPPFYSHRYTGPTILIAAMRCFVASKLGDEIDSLDP